MILVRADSAAHPLLDPLHLPRTIAVTGLKNALLMFVGQAARDRQAVYNENSARVSGKVDAIIFIDQSREVAGACSKAFHSLPEVVGRQSLGRASPRRPRNRRVRLRER